MRHVVGSQRPPKCGRISTAPSPFILVITTFSVEFMFKLSVEPVFRSGSTYHNHMSEWELKFLVPMPLGDAL